MSGSLSFTSLPIIKKSDDFVSLLIKAFRNHVSMSDGTTDDLCWVDFLVSPLPLRLFETLQTLPEDKSEPAGGGDD